MNQEKVYEEWVMLSTGDPMNQYVGHPVADPFSPSLDVKSFIEDCIEKGTPIRLKGARIFLTMIHPMPNGGMGMMSQLFPISGTGMAIDISIRATSAIFASDVPGLPEKLASLTEKVTAMETEARARAAGIVPATSLPTDRGRQ